MEFSHKPVLLKEVIEGLNIKEDGIYVDCTIGGGGHSQEILNKLSNKGKLIGFDRDIEAVKTCQKKFANYSNVQIFHANFKDAPEILKENGITNIDGVLIDLGVSSYQIDNGERGFSFLHNGKLDMRMNKDDSLDAFYIVNNYSREQLLNILYKYGEEANAKRIVDNMLKQRAIKPIETTFELKEIIESSFPRQVVYGKGGVSKKTFQAIRIEVNGELDGLDSLVVKFVDMLSPKGRFAVLTFHSLEDRIIKNAFKDACTDCICPPKTPICICHHRKKCELVNRKPITASTEELKYNSRSSSAKLRVIEKI